MNQSLWILGGILLVVSLVDQLFKKQKKDSIEENKKKIEEALKSTSREINFKYVGQSLYRGVPVLQSVYKAKVNELTIYLYKNPDINNENFHFPKEVKISTENLLNKKDAWFDLTGPYVPYIKKANKSEQLEEGYAIHFKNI